ncbi:hypothetical protein CR162_17860 [Pseudoroseomonas rhizosphaerae]|uniref:DUF4347 domain-containing protein n=1 Tax=Teichococcus rhizosphaerae TaxID=1335062 RepID=A0A2C6Z4W7_9PROT|nr:DUF4347 domain-containing protein [Pseudoroseomonas rhizosphaerae]PHK93551.1 hypothetical protein CR162_17860 [Pseudoroseomonas rhizosphaerae]
MQQNAASPRHLLVLDPRQPGWGTQLALAADDVSVLVLDTARDGLAQAAEVAAELAPLESIRLAGPGGAGWVVLGTIALEPEMVEERGWVLAALGAALCPEGQLELPGPAGMGAIGGRLVAALGRATGRDVAAAGHLAGRKPAAGTALSHSPAWTCAFTAPAMAGTASPG